MCTVLFAVFLNKNLVATKNTQTNQTKRRMENIPKNSIG
jgi:hypothetical protein